MVAALQGGVFLLQDAQGRPDPNKVLKATFKLSLGGIAGMTHMEREWAVGRRLAPIEKPGGGIPGFMATGAALVTKSHVFRGVFYRHYNHFTAPNLGSHNCVPCLELLQTTHVTPAVTSGAGKRPVEPHTLVPVLAQGSFWNGYMAKTLTSALAKPHFMTSHMYGSCCSAPSKHFMQHSGSWLSTMLIYA